MNKFKDLFERTNIWFTNITDEEWRDWTHFVAVTCILLIIMAWIQTKI